MAIQKNQMVKFDSIPGEGGEMMDLTDEEIQQYKDGGYVVEEYPDGGDVPKDKKGRPQYIGFDRLLRDREERAAGNTPFGKRGELFYKGYNTGNSSSLHPNVRKLTDMDYLEEHVNRAVKGKTGLYGGSGDYSYKKKGEMGQIPVRFNEDGKAHVASDKYGGFGYRQKGVGNMEYFPVNWEQYLRDNTGDEKVKAQFLQPVGVKAEASGYQKKLHKLPKDKRRAFVNKMNTIEEMYRQQNDIPIGQESGLSREQLYDIAKNNKDVSKAVDQYMAWRNDQTGTIKQGKAKKELTTLDKFQDVVAHPFDFFQASMGSGNASDLWSSGVSWKDQREVYKKAGEDVQINGRGTSMVGNALNTYNPVRFLADSKYNVENERWGALAMDALETAAPLYVGKAGSLVKKGLQYEKDGAIKGLNYMKGAIGSNPNNLSKLKRTWDFSKGAFGSTYHAGKLGAFPSLVNTLYDKEQIAKRGEFGTTDATDVASKLINFYNPFKKITGTSAAANFLVREGKDLFKGAGYVYKGLKKDDGKYIAKGALTGLSTLIPNKGVRKYGLKLLKEYGAEPIKNYSNNVFSYFTDPLEKKPGIQTTRIDSDINKIDESTGRDFKTTAPEGYVFADGGEYEEMELTDAQIKEYQDGGFIVEEY